MTDERAQGPANEAAAEAPEDAPEGHDVSLAIGFYIGGVVIVFGTILVLYGLLGSPDNAKSLGINLNLWWGLVTVVFGCVILGMSYASPRRRATRQQGR
jgi:hypothetical protein